MSNFIILLTLRSLGITRVSNPDIFNHSLTFYSGTEIPLHNKFESQGKFNQTQCFLQGTKV